MSNDTKHTPGPWRLERNGGYCGVYGAGDFSVADFDVAENGEVEEANIRLIAGAPEAAGLLCEAEKFCPVDLQDRIRAWREAVFVSGDGDREPQKLNQPPCVPDVWKFTSMVLSKHDPEFEFEDIGIGSAEYFCCMVRQARIGDDDRAGWHYTVHSIEVGSYDEDGNLVLKQPPEAEAWALVHSKEIKEKLRDEWEAQTERAAERRYDR